jgi:hypothetical protein
MSTDCWLSEHCVIARSCIEQLPAGTSSTAWPRHHVRNSRTGRREVARLNFIAKLLGVFTRTAVAFEAAVDSCNEAFLGSSSSANNAERLSHKPATISTLARHAKPGVLGE